MKRSPSSRSTEPSSKSSALTHAARKTLDAFAVVGALSRSSSSPHENESVCKQRAALADISRSAYGP